MRETEQTGKTRQRMLGKIKKIRKRIGEGKGRERNCM